MFSLRNVRYKDTIYIEQLDIPQNKISCIIGESGKGKSTLLKLLNNLISCDEGQIFYNNTPLSSIDPIELRRKVVMLSQMPVIYSGTIRDNLLIGLKFSEKPPVDNHKLIETLEMVQLNIDLERKATQLSGGEKQRLALARVTLLEPDVFLLDEPSSSLDEETEVFVIEKIVNHVKDKGKTLIMVSHSEVIANVFSENNIRISNYTISK